MLKLKTDFKAITNSAIDTTKTLIETIETGFFEVLLIGKNPRLFQTCEKTLEQRLIGRLTIYS